MIRKRKNVNKTTGVYFRRSDDDMIMQRQIEQCPFDLWDGVWVVWQNTESTKMDLNEMAKAFDETHWAEVKRFGSEAW